jgi:hypothetical protein
MAQPAVLETFGTPGECGFNLGMGIASAEPVVRAVDGGELVFYSEGREGSLRALGAWAAVAHEKDLVSVYADMQAGSVPEYLRDVPRSSVLGLARAGQGKRSRMRFMLYDRVKSQWINPYLFLDSLRDSRPPQIRSVSLKRDAQPVDLSKGLTLRQGMSELVADLGDSAEAGREARDAPFQVQVLVNGVERINLIWDTAREEGGRILLFGAQGRSCEELLAAGGGLRLGLVPIVRGKTDFQIIVSDFSRNSRSISFLLRAE